MSVSDDEHYKALVEELALRKAIADAPPGTLSDKGQVAERELAPLLAHIRESIIGKEQVFAGPFGVRYVVYADYTASGKSLAFIERFIDTQVRPIYANTHSTLTFTANEVNHLAHEARDIVRASLNCHADDVITFVGSGSTSAVQKLVATLQLSRNAASRVPETAMRPVVLLSIMEHHSNLLPWRESLAEVVYVNTDCRGNLDLAHMAELLASFRGRPLIVGAFSAGSNVTGLRSDVEQTTRLLHAHGALAIWDYAGAGPYVKIDMNPGDDPALALDAIVMSPHKLIGGPGSPGLLVAKRALYSAHSPRCPSTPGGGTVLWVSKRGHMYLPDLESREEGGTPNIIGIVRCGLAFQLKAAVGPLRIEAIEHMFISRALARLSANPRIVILGSPIERRVSIMSFLIRAPHDGLYLHQTFVVRILNDLFGIQTRSGCSCAGPYGAYLLGLSDVAQTKLEGVFSGSVPLARPPFLFKPGWARLNFNYFISMAEYEFLVAALEFVAEHGWRLLALYRHDFDAGCFVFAGEDWIARHAHLVPGAGKPASISLFSCRYGAAGVVMPERASPRGAPCFDGVLGAARALVEALTRDPPVPSDTLTRADMPAIMKPCLFWLTPAEAAKLAHGDESGLADHSVCVFKPLVFHDGVLDE